MGMKHRLAKGGDELPGKVREITMEEVAQHGGQNGTYWTIINNEVYDITEFRQHHPGGRLIEIAAGRDGTDLLQSYHSPASLQRVDKVLANKVVRVGTLKHKAPAVDDSFYKTVTSRVDTYLAKNGLNRHSYSTTCVVETVVSFLLFVVCSLYLAHTGYYWVAVMLGLLTGRLGFLMHMGNHAGVSSSATINMVVGKLMCFIGGSSFIWLREHQVAHHLTPNEYLKDNDCQIGDPYVRLHPEIKRTPLHKFQWLTTVVGISIGTIKWYIGDPQCMASGKVGSVRFHATNNDKLLLAAFKMSWFGLHILYPIYCQGFFNFNAWLGPWFVYMVVSAHYMENTFIVNHIQEGLVPPKQPLHWANKQVQATTNWASSSHVWNFISGGLNHQIEHHLFPAMNHYLYPQISPIVKQTCKEFGLPFHNYDNFPQAYVAMLQYVDKLGHHDLH